MSASMFHSCCIPRYLLFAESCPTLMEVLSHLGFQHRILALCFFTLTNILQTSQPACWSYVMETWQPGRKVFPASGTPSDTSASKSSTSNLDLSLFFIVWTWGSPMALLSLSFPIGGKEGDNTCLIEYIHLVYIYRTPTVCAGDTAANRTNYHSCLIGSPSLIRKIDKSQINMWTNVRDEEKEDRVIVRE